MSLDDDYKSLFDSIHRIVAAQPDQVGQLLAIILSGGPFRPFLDKPELLTKVAVVAKRYVAEKKKGAAGKPAAMSESASQSGAGRRTFRVSDVVPKGPPKA